jgi:hypothetical protein
VWLTSHEVESAALCDARERDLQPLAVRDGHVLVSLAARLVTIRLVVRESGRVSSPGPGRAGRGSLVAAAEPA